MTKEHSFQTINRGFNSVFQPNELSVGVVIPIENYSDSSIPSLNKHLERVKLIDELGFKALWVRDIPFHVPSFGDAGQLFDPFTYLGFLAGHTRDVALGVASIALPLHHPAHVAKSATTIDQLSDGRLILGIASGDRPDEYPAMGVDFEKRGELFRDSFYYMRKLFESFPSHESDFYGKLNGEVDLLPKPVAQKIPMLVTGSSRQSLEWNAENADGWMNYPRNLFQQKYSINQWRKLISEFHDFGKPFMQPLYVVLQEDEDFKPEPIPLGFRIGINYLVDYFQELQEVGVNHVAINLRFNDLSMEKTLEHLGEKLLPNFHKNNVNLHA